MRRIAGSALLVVIVLAGSCVSAQPVYKCQANGRVEYSHEPCMGAQTVDTTPTQGLDKASGRSRKGADVRRDEHNKAMGEALRPLTGMTPKERLVHHRRAKLLPAERAECYALDDRIRGEERQVMAQSGDAASAGQAALLASRKRFRALGC